MSSVSALNVLNEQFNVISTLQEGERLSVTFKGCLSKMTSPESVNKIFQALYREVTFQSEQKNLNISATHIESLTAILEGKLQPSHALLEELVQAENALLLLVDQGYGNYKKTLQSGASWLFKKDHETCLQMVENQIKSLQHLFPVLRARIQSFELALRTADEAAIQEMLGGKRVNAPLMRNVFFDAMVLKFGEGTVQEVFSAYSLNEKITLKSGEAHALLAGLYACRLRHHYEGVVAYDLWGEIKKFNSFAVNNKKEPFSAVLMKDLGELQKFKQLNLTTQLHALNREWEVLSTLEADEKLNVSRSGLLGRVTPPENCLKGAPELIRKIVILAKRLFQALYWVLTGQSDERSLKACSAHIESLKRALKDLEIIPKKNHFILDELAKAVAYFEKIQQGYEHFNTTTKDAFSAEIQRQKKEIETLITPLQEQIKLYKVTLKGEDEEAVERFIRDPNGVMPLWKNRKTCLMKEVVFEALQREFSQKAVERVFALYNMSDKTILSRDEIYALLLGLKVNVMADDYNELPVDRLIEMRRFEPLHVVKAGPHKAQLERDLNVLEELKKWAWFQKGDGSPFAHLRTAEYLARYVIYGLCAYIKKDTQFAEGLLLPGADEKTGKEICLRTKKVVAEDGVMGACFIPHNAPVDHIYVAFRGLDCLDSMFRCFDLRDREQRLFYNAVGSKTYKKYEMQILAAMDEFLNKGIKINILGHSLGGVDAQRLTLGLAKGGHNVALTTFNSPGVDKVDAEALVKVQEFVTIHHFQVLRDILQDPGHVRLGDGFQKGLKVSIFDHAYKEEDLRYSYEVWVDAHCMPLLSDKVPGQLETKYRETLENEKAYDKLLTGLGAYASS